MRRGTQNRHGENLGEFVRASLHPCRGGYQPPETPRGRVLQMNVYLTGQPPSLLLLEKVARRPDVEGTPCGIAVLKKTFKAVNSMFWLHFLTNSGARYRCPLHIPPLRRGPSPAGEGFFGFRPGVYVRPAPQFHYFSGGYQPPLLVCNTYKL